MPHADAALAGSVRRAIVVGAGVMGRGIAYAAVTNDWHVVVVDADGRALDGAVAQVEHDLDDAVGRGIIEADDARLARGRLTVTASLQSALAETPIGVVIEAVTEQLEVKREVLRSVEDLVDDDTILATNTSALSITEIMACLRRPERGVGMHFFNPVPKMRLVEVVRGERTADTTVDTAVAVAEAMGKQTVVVSDVPGFATSRINALVGNEGMRMLEDGVASAPDIDTAVRLGLRHPMGPLEMGDLVGWDTRLAILEHLQATLGERFEPTALHRRLVAEGRLGRKTGQGIYRYDADGRRIDEDPDLP